VARAQNAAAMWRGLSKTNKIDEGVEQNNIVNNDSNVGSDWNSQFVTSSWGGMRRAKP